jgi:2-polyprenyl-3-methyl-5-hydroxy-6-metoxy-1,4-benzoquinol methylase
MSEQPSFFETVRGTSADSADVVVPMVYTWLRPTRVLDVGCGEGAWLARFAVAGAAVLGLDGNYVDPSRLLTSVFHADFEQAVIAPI